MGRVVGSCLLFTQQDGFRGPIFSLHLHQQFSTESDPGDSKIGVKSTPPQIRRLHGHIFGGSLYAPVPLTLWAYRLSKLGWSPHCAWWTIVRWSLDYHFIVSSLFGAITLRNEIDWLAYVWAGLAENNGNRPPGLYIRSSVGWLLRTRISSRTLRSFWVWDCLTLTLP